MNNKQVEDRHKMTLAKLEDELGEKSKNNFKVEAIGYLDISEPAYECGDVSEDFVNELKLLYRSGSFTGSMGHHECEFCLHQGVKKLPSDAMSSSEKSLRDEENKVDYKFPQMIFHYIEVHKFKPPQKFIDFVMRGK